MHAFGVRSSSSQHFTSANPGFLFMPPSFREGVMGQAEPAPLLQPLCGCWCALNQLSYKCQPSPYSRTRPPTRGSWGSAGQCPVPLCARLRRTCRPLVLRARGSLPLPLTSQSQEPSPPFFRHWRHSASVPTLQKKRRWLFAILFQKIKLQFSSFCSTPAFFPIPAVPWNPE